MNLTEEEIRRITFDVINELGERATPETVKELVNKKIEQTPGEFKYGKGETTSGRVILTSFGLNHPGIVAGVTKALGDNNCDILDLSQKLLGDFFTMIMVIDISSSQKELKEIQEEMAKIAADMKIKIYLQHEDVFRFMHRI